MSSISTALLKSNISRLIPETYKEKKIWTDLIEVSVQKYFQQFWGSNSKTTSYENGFSNQTTIPTPPHYQSSHNKPQTMAFNRTWSQKDSLQLLRWKQGCGFSQISKYHVDILTTAGLDLWLFTASPTALIRISLSCFVACSLSLVNKHNRCLTSLLICGVPSCKLNSTNSCIRP